MNGTVNCHFVRPSLPNHSLSHSVCQFLHVLVFPANLCAASQLGICVHFLAFVWVPLQHLLLGNVLLLLFVPRIGLTLWETPVLVPSAHGLYLMSKHVLVFGIGANLRNPSFGGAFFQQFPTICMSPQYLLPCSNLSCPPTVFGVTQKRSISCQPCCCVPHSQKALPF